MNNTNVDLVEKHLSNHTGGLKMIKNKEELNDMEYLVTQENGTEPPFQNEYWNHFEKEFTLINCPANHYLLQRINLNLIAVGQVSPKH